MATGTLHQLELTISGATFHPSTAFSRTTADIYVELIVDGKKGKRTEVIPGSLSPVWNEHFDILVKPDSILLLYAFHHSRWRRDILLGQSLVCLDELLRMHNGRLQDTSLTLDLLDFSSGTKLGDLSVIFSGMTINQNSATVNHIDPTSRNSALPPASPVVPPSPPSPPPQPTSSVVNGTLPSTYAMFASLLSNPFSATGQQWNRAAFHPVVPSIHNDSIIPTSPLLHSNLPSALTRPISTSVVPSDVAYSSCDLSFSAEPLIANVPAFSNTSARDTATTLSELGFELPRQEPPIVAVPQFSCGTLDQGHSLLQVECSALPNLMSFESDLSPSSYAEEHLESDLVDRPTFSSPPAEGEVLPASASGDVIDHRTLPQQPCLDVPNTDHEDINDHASEHDIQPDENGNTIGGTLSSLGLSASPTHQQPTPSQEDSTLPPGWERRVDRYRRVYYVDHNTCTTTWIRPNPNLINRIQTFELNRHDRDLQLASIATRFLPNSLFGDRDGGRLPDGWERRLNNRGMPYFYNTNTASILLDDPRIHSLLREDPLPDGWEMRVSDGGVIYFMNHQTKEQTYRDPRGKEPKSLRSSFGVPVPHEQSFAWKLSQFRDLCASNSADGHVKISVTRESLFQDSCHQIMRIPAADLKRKMHIVFSGEDGLDYGGVAREWFLLLSLEILHPMLGLFQYVNDRNCTMQISASSYVDPNHLKYFRFIGRFVALALFHGMFIGNSFCLPFYKKMLNKRLTLKDIESIDVEVYTSLKWIRDTNLDENKMPEMYFATDFEILGRVQHYELKPGGSNIAVTEQNKNEYIILMIDWMFSRGIERQTEAFLAGLNEILPLRWLQYFDEMELELILCGMQDIDVDDWCKNTVYKHYSKTSKPIIWFWKFVRESSSEDRIRLLQFVTGTCRIPVGGFAQLMGSNGLQKFCIEKVGKEGSLPRSHTCFNRLDLPSYKSFEQLVQKLRFAIHETQGFGIE